MVNLSIDSLSIGLAVEFLINNTVESGFVRYKGSLNGKEGDWIGIEANKPVGYCDGRLNGRVYFKCSEMFGLFLTADELRLAKLSKKSVRKLYKSVDSECDEILFKKIEPKDYTVCITEDYLESAKTSFQKRTYSDIFSSAPSYASRQTLVSSKPKVKNEIKQAPEASTFKPVSSISKAYMPSEELELYTKLAWSHRNIKCLPRNSNLNKTFDSFNQNRSNYI